ncbi:peptidoglycan editing factor PgeF [Nocardioides mangrovicus]|uniref:Purine nucleoside phosphorylase n=1 Tax=Nocardioides mangrovicus TaxID=2478913 RepID=A0A3L8P0K2_9ACTN|nr:peptidoglycan editing factor PgeF [Nocardioides mangrovicus]RLV48966.1 peptidoglycan editing factor PgeF [Nocardioides mangrovicus]
MFAARDRLGRVEVAFTDRHGGVSHAPFDSLNLGFGGGPDRDEPAAVAENHRRVLAAFAPGARWLDLDQVHGAHVVVAEEHAGPGRPRGDALVTTSHDVVLLARAADCVPVLLADPDAGVVAAVHSGRPGVAKGVVPAAVARMRELGARDITGWVGPHVCGACYEVPADLQEEVATLEPATRATTSWGTPALDIGAGVRAQLARADVAVVDLSRCTRESEDLFSYRGEGPRSGRLAGLIRLVA